MTGRAYFPELTRRRSEIKKKRLEEQAAKIRAERQAERIVKQLEKQAENRKEHAERIEKKFKEWERIQKTRLKRKRTKTRKG